MRPVMQAELADQGAHYQTTPPTSGLRNGFMACCGADDPAGVLRQFWGLTDRDAGLAAWFGDEALAAMSGPQCRRALQADIAEIDVALNRLVNAVRHHPRFKRLEALWRGVAWLVETASPDRAAHVKLLNVTWNDLGNDLERAPDFDQSELFEKIYSQEFGTVGGVPFGLVISEHEVRHKPTRGQRSDDISILRHISGVAAAAFCPFVFGVSPEVFEVDSFADLDLRQDLSMTFQQPDYQRFWSLRRTPDARFLALVVPRILLRSPQRGRSAGDLGFCYEEDESQGYLWQNGAFAFAQVVIRAFIDFRWMAAIRGSPQNELVGGIIVPTDFPDFESEAPYVALRGLDEVEFSVDQENHLSRLGFISFRPCYATPYSAFYHVPSLHEPPVYDKPIATLNARLGSMIHYILCVSRFSHYIKVIAREWVGSYKTANDCERLLQGWIDRYCTGNSDASLELKAKYPLRSAQVKVSEKVGSPGAYNCIVELQPHFQIDQVLTEFKIITELEKSE